MHLFSMEGKYVVRENRNVLHASSIPCAHRQRPEGWGFSDFWNIVIEPNNAFSAKIDEFGVSDLPFDKLLSFTLPLTNSARFIILLAHGFGWPHDEPVAIKYYGDEHQKKKNGQN